MTFSTALSSAPGVSSASTSRAISRKRWYSAGSLRGLGVFGLRGIAERFTYESVLVTLSADDSAAYVSANRGVRRPSECLSIRSLAGFCHFGRALCFGDLALVHLLGNSLTPRHIGRDYVGRRVSPARVQREDTWICALLLGQVGWLGGALRSDGIGWPNQPVWVGGGWRGEAAGQEQGKRKREGSVHGAT